MSIKQWLILAGLFALRVFNLNQSLWLDEAITAQKAKLLDYWQLVEKFSIWDFHPPLHYWLVRFFGSAFGFGEVWIRLPSVLAAIVVAYVLYKMAGWWASALWLANPLALYYSQEARMYMLSCMFLVLTWWGLNQKKCWSGLTAFFALSTFYGSIFFLGALLLIYWKEKNKLLYGFVLAGVCWSGLLFGQWQNSRQSLVEVKNWSLVLGRVEFRNLALIPLKFFVGRISFEPKLLYFFVGGLWSVFCLVLGFFKSKRELIIIPLALAVVVSFWAPMIQYFRFLYLVPVFIVGLSQYPTKLKFVVLTGFVFWSLFYILNSNNWREDWKSLANSLPLGATIYMSENFGDPLKYYRPDLVVQDLKKSDRNTLGVVYATNYGVNIMGIDYTESMSKLGCLENEQKSFRGIRLDRWTCN